MGYDVVMNLSIIYMTLRNHLHVVEPEDLTFAEDVEINDDTIFVQDDPFYDDHMGNYCCLPRARRPDGDSSAKP